MSITINYYGYNRGRIGIYTDREREQMTQKDAYELLIKEYISKCKCCDECVASYFCTENNLRNSREPKDYCKDNLKAYFRQR